VKCHFSVGRVNSPTTEAETGGITKSLVCVKSVRHRLQRRAKKNGNQVGVLHKNR